MTTDPTPPEKAPASLTETALPTPDGGITLEVATADRAKSSRLAGLFSALVSLAMLVAVAWEVHKLDMRGVVDLIPLTAPFWIVYGANYLIQPLSEWAIYRRLWGIPLVSGMGALLRKLVSNELLLGYLGEVQFYAWARAKLSMVTAPFGAIKDMTILSALTGNIATLAMLTYAWPFVQSGVLGKDMATIFTSLGVVLVTSFAILLFRQKLFSLPRRELWAIAGVHFLRIFAYVGLTALMWHLVLPDQPYIVWLALATLRMLISRLPLLPNKDVVFAGLAVLMLGHDAEISSLMTMIAALLLVTHLVVGTIFALVDLVTERVR
jgi:hypothetical protein